MNWTEAATEARRRWGEDGRVRKEYGERCIVGVVTFRPGSCNVEERGAGASWEDAFADADGRGAIGQCACRDLTPTVERNGHRVCCECDREAR